MLTKKQVIIFSCIIVLIWIFIQYALGNGKAIEITTHKPGTPVVLSIYYEALCPDSKHFIIKQLLPAYKAAPSLLDIVLVPYGKASTSLSAEGTLQFDCQHGPLECQANIYHACVIEAIRNPQTRLDVVACMIKDNRLPKEALHKCAREFSLDTTDLIQKCHDSAHGSELLKLNGEATHALRPSVSFIPTITIDGSQGKQAAILKNLMGEVCKVVKGDSLAENIC